MNIAESFVKMIEREGIILEHRSFLVSEIDKAIESGCFSYLTFQGKYIGFFTWVFDKETKLIIIENMLVNKQFRGIFNMLSIRKILRDKYGRIGAFSWKNRKKQKMVKFQERGQLCSV